MEFLQLLEDNLLFNLTSVGFIDSSFFFIEWYGSFIIFTDGGNSKQSKKFADEPINGKASSKF